MSHILSNEPVGARIFSHVRLRTRMILFYFRGIKILEVLGEITRISKFLADLRSLRNDGQCTRGSARTSETGGYLGGNREHGRVSVETVLSLGPRRDATSGFVRFARTSVKKFAFGVGSYNSRERSLFCITSSAGAEIYDRSHLSCREAPRSPRLLSRFFAGIGSLARLQP